MRLSLRVQHLHGESLSSFLSRLASANGVRLNAFCSHLSIRALRFVNGDTAEIDKVATLAGVDAGELHRQAITRVEEGFVIGGERLQRSSLRRDRLCVCPRCLQDDLQDGRPIYGRTSWQVAHLRACHEHHIELLDLGAASTLSALHDVAARLEPIVTKLADFSSIAPPASHSPFEDYVRGRLQSVRQDSPFLDSLELHAAARICELFGAVASRGVWAALRDFSVAAWRAAADQGFEFASRGEVGIRAFLSALQVDRSSSATGHDGPQACFGALYDRLSRGSRHAAFEPIRDLVHRHIVETMPISTGDVVLGRTVERQTVHSVRTAHVQTGLHPKRLTKILTAAEVISASKVSDGLKRFDARSADEILTRFVGALSLKETGAYLGSDRVHTRLLHDGGFIKSMSATGGKMAFAKADLDDFLAALLGGANTLSEQDERAASIPLAAKRANCSAMEIVKLVLDRELSRRGIAASKRGYGALLVDFEEVRGLVRGAPLDGLPRRWIIKELKTSSRVVDALIAGGVLTTEQQINPLNRCPVEVVPRKAFAAFRESYATLFELASEAGCHPRTLKSNLEAAGVRPALESATFHASFYRRADTPT